MIVLAAGAVFFVAPAHAAAELKDYLGAAQPGEFFADADRFGPPEGSPPIVPVFSGERLRGYLYLNTDFANATGYSGKPISLLVGIDTNGVISGIKLVDHKEPIVLIGIPVQRIIATMNSLIGRDIRPIATGAENPPQVDIVSGATVTVLVMADSVVRSAVRLIRSGRVAGGSVAGGGTGAALPQKAIDFTKSDIRDWNDLLGDGSVRRLHLSIGEVSDAFAKAGNKTAAENPEPGAEDDVFIDLYAALVTVPTIGRSLLGNDGYDRLMAQLKPGQQAILIAGDGAYSFKGSGYVRGGIFDRIELLQDGSSTRFRDRNHTRLGGLAAQGAPVLREVSLFVVPNELTLDPAAPWQIQLLVQRATATREKAFQTFELGYALPDTYLKQERPAPSPPQAAASAMSPAAQAAPAGDLLEDPLWMRIWRGNVAAIGLTAFTLLALTAIFFFQDALVRRPAVYEWVRRAFLLFILVWLGWYANAQLSVVNVVTFTSALITGFKWEFFLASPLTFILWSAVAVGLLFWGRGPFCGWLCPFGALQELLSTVAKWLKVPQVTVPWGLHERLWPIKYILFIGLFGLSLYSVALTETLAEVEPFKTAIILKFAREWPYVVYALTLLCAGLFIERFFCRYLCPLGAALAIPGRMRTFEWLKRWSECGSPCQRCAKECPVQSIHPEGHINVNECIYCMHCQMLYHDDHRCPHMIQVRLKRERFEALSSPSMLSGGKAKPTITHNGRPIDRPATVDAPLPPTS
ncbi:NosR/NirI family protein [Azorhizobium doebereinerae]|uniref:NosR/NirI family protein n=1 Tax=Azorhizobium doebereinerae TaxID=281091 RepID=UPI001FD93EF5|nr:NosR/NirI family protein [Azorhizobium doebereinerae]